MNNYICNTDVVEQNETYNLVGRITLLENGLGRRYLNNGDEIDGNLVLSFLNIDAMMEIDGLFSVYLNKDIDIKELNEELGENSIYSIKYNIIDSNHVLFTLGDYQLGIENLDITYIKFICGDSEKISIRLKSLENTRYTGY